MMSEAPERIWDFWPHDGGSPVLWREPCPFPAEDAEVFKYVRADRIAELLNASKDLLSIVEGIQGSFNHGAWRDEKNSMRLKDTNEWVSFYVAFVELTKQMEDE